MRKLVVGIGNDLRGDDGVGLIVVRSLQKLSLPDVGVVELNNDVFGLLEHLQGYGEAIIIDAIHSGSRPGTIHRFDASNHALPGIHSQRSTHGINLASILELARSQGTLPQRVLVYGIEGESFEYGSTLAPQVELSVNRLVDTVRHELLNFKT
jgi:hydrogenase maturation protease